MFAPSLPTRSAPRAALRRRGRTEGYDAPRSGATPDPGRQPAGGYEKTPARGVSVEGWEPGSLAVTGDQHTPGDHDLDAAVARPAISSRVVGNRPQRTEAFDIDAGGRNTEVDQVIAHADGTPQR